MISKSHRPNILFIIADDHRHNAINALGDYQVETPNLDGLVNKGTALTNMYIMGSTVGAVCMPSRGMMLTGRSLWSIDEPDLGEWSLWPQILRESGYVTYGIGKWHNERNSFSKCFSDGAEIFFGGMSDHYSVPVHNYDPTGEFSADNARVTQEFSTDLFTQATTDFLRDYSGTDPFCLYVAFTAPHDPRTPPQRFTYNPNDIELPGNYLSQHPFDNGEMDVRDELLDNLPRTEDAIRKHIADYYGMVSHLDSSIGAILQTLDESGLSENTVVIYTADHGLALGQHGLLGKQNLYEHSIKVPFIIRGPQIPANVKLEAFCYLYDLAPTLFDMLGITVPGSVEGQSFWGTILKGEPHRTMICSAYKNKHRSIRNKRYKLIEYYLDGKVRRQMFDLLFDPLELENLLRSEKTHHNLLSMQLALRDWQAHVSDPMMIDQTSE